MNKEYKFVCVLAGGIVPPPSPALFVELDDARPQAVRSLFAEGHALAEIEVPLPLALSSSLSLSLLGRLVVVVVDGRRGSG